jgi:thiol-disulfide isomerase/thioredoxin
LTEQFDNRLRLDRHYSSDAGTASQQQQQQQHSQQQSIHGAPQEISQPSSSGGESYDLNQFMNNKEKDNFQKKKGNHDDESDGDSEFDDDDDDPAVEAFRERRLAELKRLQTREVENKSKGHGDVRTITQDEFLPECTSSEYVAIHFFHRDFERCKIMDHHLKVLAPLHLSCKFIRIDAEKTPFFVIKLKVQTLPTLLLFKDGKTIDRLVGFEDLADVTSKDPDDFPTSRLGYWLEKRGAIEYEGPDSDDEESSPRRATPYGMNRTNVFDEDS